MERLTHLLAMLVERQRTSAEAEQHLRQIITDFGSATPDNVACANLLTLLQSGDTTGVGTRNGRLVSDIINAAENYPPHPDLLRELPGLSDAEWQAALRICTLILADLEYNRDAIGG